MAKVGAEVLLPFNVIYEISCVVTQVVLLVSVFSGLYIVSVSSFHCTMCMTVCHMCKEISHQIQNKGNNKGCRFYKIMWQKVPKTCSALLYIFYSLKQFEKYM